MKVQWADLKTFVNARALSIQWIEFTDKYYLLAIDGGFQMECELLKSPSDTTDLNDFINNYKALGNKKLNPPTDSDGSSLSRAKITTTGWHFQLHSFEAVTGKLDSVYSKNHDGTLYNFGTIKFYKLVNGVKVEIVGAELTQANLDTLCIRTIVDYEFTFDFELIGGELRQLTVPNNDIYLYIIGVPDVPDQYGGSKVFVSGVDLQYVGTANGIKIDGRAPKYLTYSSTQHTNKLRFILDHHIAFNHKFCVLLELFKA